MSEYIIPVIDIGPLINGNADGEKEVARRIGEACRTIGFFYIVGHGVDPTVIDSIFETMMEFFQQPLDFKRKSGFVSNRGYVPIGGEALDPNRPGDLKEAFNIGLELEIDDPETRKPFLATNVWPDIPGFKNLMLDYYDRMRHIGMTLHRAFSLDLGVDPSYFSNQFREPMAILRLLHYPPTEHQPLNDGQMGAGVHTDYGNVTILKTDSVGGLMVQTRDGTWLDAPVIADAFVCNIGDCLMRWTNDIYVSTPHKVFSPKNRDRYSIAFFFDADPEAIVSCLPSCSGSHRPVKYPPVTASDYLQSRLSPTYAHQKVT